jgi:hypothetical protein
MNIRYWLRHPDRFVRRVWHYFYEIRHPDEPFLAPAAVRFLDRNLARDGAGLEWGSGRSTAWFAQRLATLVTVEHDPAWRSRVEASLERRSVHNVDIRVIPLEHPESEPTVPVYDPVPQYVSFVEEFPDEHFSFVEVDGHYRQACVRAGLGKLKRGGLLLVDDTNWIPLEEWGVPATWPLIHQSTKIDTVTSVWRKP